jgi:hypothetical protein
MTTGWASAHEAGSIEQCKAEGDMEDNELSREHCGNLGRVCSYLGWLCRSPVFLPSTVSSVVNKPTDIS